METLLLTVGFLIMAAGAAVFLFMSTQSPPQGRYFHYITATIAAIAAFSYLMMATGSGAVLVGDRLFYYFRYVDWVLTTLLLLLDLALLALVNPRRNAALIATLMGVDVFMILTGWLAGSRLSGFGRGFFFLVSTAALIVLLYLLWTRLFAAAATRTPAVQDVFRTLAYLTVILWALYPVVWLLGIEGFGAVGSATEVFLFLILDLLAKIGFGFLLLTNQQAIADATGGGRLQPSRVR